MTATLPTPGAPPTADAPTADTAAVAEHLMAEFEGRIDLAEVTRAVRECWQGLRRSGPEPATTVLEQCAREQLTARCAG